MNNYFTYEVLYNAWKKLRKGKRWRSDVQKFELNLEMNLKVIYDDLSSGNYRHQGYSKFQIMDKKRRSIAKASVPDRIIHQAVYDYLVSVYDNSFYFHSYSSRVNKGADKARTYLKKLLQVNSLNLKKDVWVLKCDVRKYFDSITHYKLFSLLERRVKDRKILSVIGNILNSYNSGVSGRGLPLGNVTSQIFANIYLQELDYFIKNNLKFRKYIRYNDDLIFIDLNMINLIKLSEAIRQYCKDELLLDIKEVFVRKLSWGVDFLGHKFFPKAELLVKPVYVKIDNNMQLTVQAYNSGALNEDYMLSLMNSYNGLAKSIGGRPLKLLDLRI